MNDCYNKEPHICSNEKVINNIVSYPNDRQQKSPIISIKDTNNYNKISYIFATFENIQKI
jgi:hypothetical protein